MGHNNNNNNNKILAEYEVLEKYWDKRWIN